MNFLRSKFGTNESTLEQSQVMNFTFVSQCYNSLKNQTRKLKIPSLD